ncbi:MAG: hypothetical protein AAF939_12680 [Planctomycetota bacterium]
MELNKTGICFVVAICLGISLLACSGCAKRSNDSPDTSTQENIVTDMNIPKNEATSDSD